jgi:hypothetical protein
MVFEQKGLTLLHGALTSALTESWNNHFSLHVIRYLRSILFVTTSGKSYPYCIPYEGNEHLLNTTNDCDEFYRNL